MTRGDQALAHGMLAGGGQNGRPEPKPYRYRGTKLLADEPNTIECAGGCGRLIQDAFNVTERMCAVCRGSSALGLDGGQ